MNTTIGCPIPGASQPRGMRFDAENSRCIPAEQMTPDELRQLHRLDNEMEEKEK